MGETKGKTRAMGMEEHKRKFLELLRYVGFIKEEKIKIQKFLSGLPTFTKTKSNMMNQNPLKRPSERLSIYMIIIEGENI